MYHIVGYQTNPITGETIFNILCDTVADLPSSPVSDNGYGGEIGQGSKAVIIADGSRYLADSNRQWIYQPNPNAWVNVYTKLEIDEMITEIYETIAYYHTTLVSDTGEITFYAVAGYIGTWTIFGNGQQTGTPTPDNPVMPTFCGVRTGNLVEVSNSNCIIYSTYNQFTIENDTVHIAGNALFGFIVKCSPNTQYTVSSTRTGYNCDMRIREYSEKPSDWATDFITQSVNVSLVTASASFTTNSATKYMLVCFYGSNTSKISSIMLNLGSTALPYEPYGYKIPISCGGQTVPVYLGQTQTVRRIKKLVLTGEEDWIYVPIEPPLLNRFACDDTVQSTADYTIGYSTHYIYEYKNEENRIFHASNMLRLYVCDNRYTSASDFKAYLAAQYAAGTPVTVWYVLAEPETAIVNEPLAKIGDYADELSSTDSGVQIPTVKGQNTLTVDTILKPSRIEIQG